MVLSIDLDSLVFPAHGSIDLDDLRYPLMGTVEIPEDGDELNAMLNRDDEKMMGRDDEVWVWRE